MPPSTRVRRIVDDLLRKTASNVWDCGSPLAAIALLTRPEALPDGHGLRNVLERPLLFRGHADSRWTLIATLDRAAAAPIGVRRVRDALKRVLLNWFAYFAQEFKSFEIGASDEVCDALLQHYGFPTNLLDWTTDPFVALDFATPPHSSGHASLVMLPVERALELEMSMVIPPPIFERVFIQRGVFTALDAARQKELEDAAMTLTFAFPPYAQHPVPGAVRGRGLLPPTGFIDTMVKAAVSLLALDVDSMSDDDLHNRLLFSPIKPVFSEEDLVVFEIFFAKDILSFMQSLGLLEEATPIELRRSIADRIRATNASLVSAFLESIAKESASGKLSRDYAKLAAVFVNHGA